MCEFLLVRKELSWYCINEGLYIQIYLKYLNDHDMISVMFIPKWHTCKLARSVHEQALDPVFFLTTARCFEF
jgi:hypothetical protein